MPTIDRIRRVQGPLYFVGALLLFVPALDYLTNVWPLRPGDLQWRYGSVGLLSGYLITPVLGGAFLTLLAGLKGDRGLARVLAVVFLLLTVGLLAATGVFTLDVLQLRTAVGEDRRIVIEFGSARAALKLLLFAGAFAWLGIAGFRVKREGGGEEKPSRRASGSIPTVAAKEE